ncbi:arginine succinyltransferase [Panacagrimonas perspica]|uniref:Arginine N-succinyltransferase n=1 Tax=Panacagrimonas perspica TaxID=381431 RepID=A0A4R7NSX3_9GAMM|nr:arginine N-succinyltransferase [Panacagrimonas perspica]TDU24153.1 arginine succinyltransferase [Panacagrimonas perspica]THD04569.1 arginine N-succinyltransferase [Panacagrimonas perspica]
MNLIRPIRLDDLDALLEIARGAGAGFTSLPPDRDYLRDRIELSLSSFAAPVSQAGHERYLFVLQDGSSGLIGGCCAIEAACGLDEPFYSYRVGETVQASQKFEVYNRTQTLYLTNDYTGASVLCSLYLRPEFRGKGGAGRLLSRCRFLFMAAHPARFADRVIAEMRGVSDERGRSPFWEGLGRHFFSVEYAEAEHIVGMGNKSFIAELMPAHPIYAVLLPAEARAVMGQVHAHTAPALRLLQSEGLRHTGYIDIFDGGPTVEAPVADIRAIRKSRVLEARVSHAVSRGTAHLVSNDALDGFRCVMADLAPARDHVVLDQATAAALNIRAGDSVRTLGP